MSVLNTYGELDYSPDTMRFGLKKHNNKVSIIRQNTAMSVIYIAFIVYDKTEYVGHKLYNALSGLLQLDYVCHKHQCFCTEMYVVQQ